MPRFDPPNSATPRSRAASNRRGAASKRSDVKASVHSEVDVEAEAVRTFELEGGAGRTAGAVDVSLPSAPVRTLGAKTQAAVEAVPREVPCAEVAASEGVAVNALEPTLPTIDIRTKPNARRPMSWWGASFGLHAIALPLLGFSTFAIQREATLDLYSAPAVHDVVDELEELELEAPTPLEPLEEFTEELEEPTTDPIVEVPMLDVAPLGEPAPAIVSDAESEIGNLFGNDGLGLTDLGTGAGEAPAIGTMAKFFGTEITARRVLYMLDNSGGMRKGGKFEALVAELQASVDSLDEKQEFYVIFYSDTVYPLFFPRSVRRFVRANKKNRQTLAKWLDSVELCGGNAIDEALAAAAVIRPDAVFLLTDGDLFTTDKKRKMLLSSDGRRYPIHTFGLGVGEQTKTAAGLRAVAEANGGTFRAIKISTEMKALARENPRPYHNKEPGPVWGIKVGKW